MNTIEDIAYAPDHGIRGLGDLYLPTDPAGAPVALCIHGGGWNAMDKCSWAGVAQLMCEEGYAAFNINYRLLDIAPWPACGDDCVAAAEFLLEADRSAIQQLDRGKGVVIIGGSAGGHLALWTALHLPQDRVRAVISIAGPGDLLWRTTHAGREFAGTFFGTEGEVTDRMLLDASPISYIKPGVPPLLCVHSTHDKLVPIEQTHRMARAWHDAGGRAEVFAYGGPGEQHGIWVDGSEPHRLLKEPDNAIRDFLESV